MEEVNASVIAEVTPRGDLVEALVNMVETRNRAQVIGIKDPVSGVVANVVLAPSGAVTPLPASTYDDYIDAPRFRRGKAVLTNLDSFIAHVNRFKDSESVVFACDDRTKPSLTCVLDYHPSNTVIETEGGPPEIGVAAPRFGRHRSQFDFPLSDEWQAWSAKNGEKNAMGVADFAAFLEDRIGDVAAPGEFAIPQYAETYIDRIGGKDRIATPSQLVELSKGLHINENAAVRNAANISTGEGEVIFTTEHTGEGGAPLRIPTSFQIGIPVFRNDAWYGLVARLRYRLRGGGIVFWYDLYRLDLVFDNAFNFAVEKVRNETGLPALRGAPETA